MSFQHLPGTRLAVLDADMKPAGIVEVHYYMRREKAYEIWWVYEQTGEKEKIRVPEWRLVKKELFQKNNY
jgi:hypothetical protein